MTNVEKLIAALAGPAQDVENMLQQLLLQRAIDTAVGVQLDQLGVIVGQARLGLDDDTYRQFLRARIAANKSEGHFEDLIDVAALILNDTVHTVQTTDEGTATVRVLVGAAALPDSTGVVIFQFEFASKAGGVRVVVQWMESAPSATFRLDAGPGLDVGHLSSDEG